MASLAHRPAWARAVPSIVDFAIGQPSSDVLPSLELLQQALSTRFNAAQIPQPNQSTKVRDPECVDLPDESSLESESYDIRYMLQYGPGAGDSRFRESLARVLSESYRFHVDPETLIVTNGSSHGLDLCLRLHCKPGDRVWVEPFTYFLSLQMFRDHGVEVEAVHVEWSNTRNGCEFVRLSNLPYKTPAMWYMIPVHSNPTGRCYSTAEARTFATVCSERIPDTLIVSDDVYGLLTYDSPANVSEGHENKTPILAKWIRNSVSLGSFSKIFAPGLRLGWLQSSCTALRDRIMSSGILSSGGGFNPFTSNIVGATIENGSFRSLLSNLRSAYASRLSAMVQELRSSCPSCTFDVPNGGYFVWMRLPAHIDSTKLLQFCDSCSMGVRFLPGSRCLAIPDGKGSDSDALIQSYRSESRSSVRLCFAFYSESEIISGIQSLGRAIQQYAPPTC